MGEDQALERLREILARPEYQVDRSVPWWQQLLAPLFDLIGYLVARFVQTLADSATGREGWLGLIALVVCAVLFGIAAAYLLRAIRLSVMHENELARVSSSQRRERSEQLWQAAQRLATAGQLAEAVRLLYLSALYAQIRARGEVAGTSAIDPKKSTCRRLAPISPRALASGLPCSIVTR